MPYLHANQPPIPKSHVKMYGGSGEPFVGLRRSALRKSVAVIALALVSAGCAVDNAGFVAAHITEGRGAWVADVYSIGAQVRLRAEAAGASLGYQRQTYVFPSDKVEIPSPGWHFFFVDLPDQNAVAFDSRQIGVSVNTSADDLGFSFGLSDRTVLARVPTGENILMHLRYTPGSPADTVVSIVN